MLFERYVHGQRQSQEKTFAVADRTRLVGLPRAAASGCSLRAFHREGLGACALGRWSHSAAALSKFLKQEAAEVYVSQRAEDAYAPLLAEGVAEPSRADLLCQCWGPYPRIGEVIRQREERPR